MENRIDCFIASLEGYVYIIPVDLRDKFDGIDYYNRQKVFERYILPDDAIIESAFIDDGDMENLINGDFI